MIPTPLPERVGATSSTCVSLASPSSRPPSRPSTTPCASVEPGPPHFPRCGPPGRPVRRGAARRPRRTQTWSRRGAPAGQAAR